MPLLYYTDLNAWYVAAKALETYATIFVRFAVFSYTRTVLNVRLFDLEICLPSEMKVETDLSLVQEEPSVGYK